MCSASYNSHLMVTYPFMNEYKPATFTLTWQPHCDTRQFNSYQFKSSDVVSNVY